MLKMLHFRQGVLYNWSKYHMACCVTAEGWVDRRQLWFGPLTTSPADGEFSVYLINLEF